MYYGCNLPDPDQAESRRSEASLKPDAFKERLKSDNRTSGISKKGKDESAQGEGIEGNASPQDSAHSRDQLEGCRRRDVGFGSYSGGGAGMKAVPAWMRSRWVSLRREMRPMAMERLWEGVVERAGVWCMNNRGSWFWGECLLVVVS